MTKGSQVITLWEVIVKQKRRPAFGMTFHDEHEAKVFADAMSSKGLQADVSPAFETEVDALGAIRNAYKFHGVV